MGDDAPKDKAARPESFTVFADESGTSADYQCFGIGCLILPSSAVDGFNARFAELAKEHGLNGELRWTKIKKSHGSMNLAIDMTRMVLEKGWRFSVIVVLKRAYRNWQSGDQETAFYKMYSLLLRDRVENLSGDYAVFYDDHPDAYTKRDEVMQKVSNSMLRNVESRGELKHVERGDSKLLPGIQVADLITGAVTASHNRHLDPGMQIAPGKVLLMRRLAALLGWDDLVYDTYPAAKFNIWNFPMEEYRGVPASQDVTVNLNVPYVTGEELQHVIDEAPDLG